MEMDAYQAIVTRQSIRKYTAERVPDEVIQELLTAGMSAPSGGNSRPWHFVVVTAREQLDALAVLKPVLARAPLAIVVCGDTELSKHKEAWAINCSLASQNILLAAHARGLGAVWLGCYPVPDRVARVVDILSLPDRVIPLNMIAIGYPAEEKDTVDRYDASRVHYNKW
jgi:nitroreductase